MPREALFPPRQRGQHDSRAAPEQPVTVPQVTRADHRHFRDTFWLTEIPPCFLDLEPEGSFLRLASAGSGVGNLGLFYSAAETGSRLMGELGMVL